MTLTLRRRGLKTFPKRRNNKLAMASVIKRPQDGSSERKA